MALAVPLWIERLRPQVEADPEFLLARTKEIQEIDNGYGVPLIGSEDILFRSKKPGDTAKAFNLLAESVALLSFCPGGVRVFGSHFDASTNLGRQDTEGAGARPGN